LIHKINDGVAYIADGRKGLSIIGETEAGLVAYRIGLSDAMAVFQEAAVGADAKSMILVELAFLTEEKRFCDSSDTIAIGSLKTAIDSFDDALRALKAVIDSSFYRGAELTYPQIKKYRVSKMPKDAFHIACIAHKTRLNNTLKTPGLNMIEKAIYKQRIDNMGAAEKVYLEMQKNALA
jgi:hypothetical protein